MFSSIAANIFAIVSINYWIYYARAAFIATHPDYVALQPPTISRAISDPAIGEPFAFWVTLSAIALIPGMLGISLAYGRIARGAPVLAARVLMLTAVGLALFQAASSVGIYLLSSYRFPNHNYMHMMGSYIFFIAQAMVMVMFLLLGVVALRCRVTMQRVEHSANVQLRWVRLRAGVACLSIAMVLIYMVLFLIKTMDFGAANEFVYATYVLAEPVVISSFLLCLAMFQTDLWAIARGRDQSRDKDI